MKKYTQVYIGRHGKIREYFNQGILLSIIVLFPILLIFLVFELLANLFRPTYIVECKDYYAQKIKELEDEDD